MWVVVSCLFFQVPVHSEVVRWSGFGSITGGFIDESHTFRNSDYTEDFEFKTDSKLALQADIDLEERLSATVQLLAKGDNDFEPKFEWAYITYDVVPDFSLRAGRLRAPFYSYSDYLDVGYAQPFSSPPKTMYSISFSSYDGLSLLHNTYIRDWDILTNLFYGSVTETLFGRTTPTDGKLEHMYGINTQASLDWFSVYIAFTNADVVIPIAVIEGNADDLVTAGASAEAASKLRIDGDEGTFLAGGFTIDYENWIVGAEASKLEVKNALFPENSSWYLLLPLCQASCRL